MSKQNPSEWMLLGLMKEAITRSSNFLEYKSRMESVPEDIMNRLNEGVWSSLLEIFTKINKKIVLAYYILDYRNRDAWPLWKDLHAEADSFEQVARRALLLPAEDLAFIAEALGVALPPKPPELDLADNSASTRST